MPYITREDGEHFVIPSYRDVLAAKNKNALKREILQLSQSYGEYITMQKKGPLRYEVAFSNDTGYLLGETVWYQFKRPLDLIYCEAIANTTEAILVIVKSGSVYLDGRFPIDTIPEELVIFLTQENNFDIYTYGDVPICQTPEEGKFSFEANSVKSFTVLDKPVFATLPKLRIYQLQLVDPVLKANGIGVFPFKETIVGIVVIGLAWMMWSYITSEKEEQAPQAPPVNPYQGYNDELQAAAPEQQITAFINQLSVLYSMPGWSITKVDYSPGGLLASVVSSGSKIEALQNWAKENNANVSIGQNGINVSLPVTTTPRPLPKNIYKLKDVITNLIDRIATIYPGNHLDLGDLANKGLYQEYTISINFDHVSPNVLLLIGMQLKDMPLVLQSMSVTAENGLLSGSINLTAAGN